MLIKEALSAHLVLLLPDETERNKELVTGIVTFPSVIEMIKARSDLVQSAVLVHKRGRMPSVKTLAVPVGETHPADQTPLFLSY